MKFCLASRVGHKFMDEMSISWQAKFALDVWYVDNWSLWLDIKVIFLSVYKVLRREGISQPGQATAEPFLGNPSETDNQSSTPNKG
jgi:hypothetical protein